MTAKSAARSCCSSEIASEAIWPTSCGVRATDRPSVSPWPCCARPPSTSSTERRGWPRCGVVRQLGGAADVGVVAADDDHGVAPRLDRLVPLDDARQGGVGVVAHVVVGDAHAVVVSEVDAVVVEQHLEHVVAFGRGARDGAEHPRARRHAAEGVEDAQSHGGFARMTFGRRDVDALRHPISLLRAPTSPRGCFVVESSGHPASRLTTVTSDAPEPPSPTTAAARACTSPVVDLDRNPRVRVDDVRLLAAGWHVLRATTFRYRGDDGEWVTQNARDLRPRQRRDDPALRRVTTDRAADPAVPLPRVRQRPPRRHADRDRGGAARRRRSRHRDPP